MADSVFDRVMAKSKTASTIEQKQLQKSVWEVRTSIVGFLVAVAPLIGVIIAWVNGVFTVDVGSGFFRSTGFWIGYGGIWVFIAVGVADFLILRLMHRQYRSRGYRMIEPPVGYGVACAATFFAVFGAYYLWLWTLALAPESPPVWGFLLVCLAIFAVPYGAWGLPDHARDVDRAFFPWDWHRVQ
jgi:hypothetical protein